MKKISVFLLLLSLSLASCVNESENFNNLLERERANIEKYIADNPISSVKEEVESDLGIYLFWLEESNSGITVNALDTLKIDYTGRLLDNSVFDTSIESVAKENDVFNSNRTYEPFGIIFLGNQNNRLVQGFEYALSKMELGDRVIVIFPSIYGYGSGSRPGIPPNSPLLFEIDLLEINGISEEEE